MNDDNVWRVLDRNLWGMPQSNWLRMLELPLNMLELPLRRTSPPSETSPAAWILRWAWPLAGLMFGAFIAPPLLERADLANLSYSGALEIGLAVLAASVVQSAGWLLVALAFHVLIPLLERLDAHIGDWWADRLIGPAVALGLAIPVLILPLAGIGYSIYRYVAWVGPSQQALTVAFVGGLLAMMILPLIRTIVTSKLFKFIINWLRGDKAKSRGA